MMCFDEAAPQRAIVLLEIESARRAYDAMDLLRTLRKSLISLNTLVLPEAAKILYPQIFFIFLSICLREKARLLRHQAEVNFY